MDLRNLRKEYTHSVIRDKDLPEEPFQWFRDWFHDAAESGEAEPSAMVLSTVSAENKPSSRIVLLKSLDEKGFVFFSNYMSRKGIQLNTNYFAALNFYWTITERQVRIEGLIEKVSERESDDYFFSRPLESRINAVISPQSMPIASRNQLEMEHEKYFSTNANEHIPRPPHWGGYRLKPDRIEFWQGRPGRLHDRILYLREDNVWNISRLAP
jgi:pyridoxamine 5'-phosphate oxidase